MIARIVVFSVICALAMPQGLFAQEPPGPGASDPAIAQLLAGIDASRLHADDTKLVGFGTRSLFSERTKSANRGVFAARDWIAEQMREIAASSGGRMAVTLDTYTTPQLEGMARPALCSSVIATLKGDDPNGRTYVMSSHFDSRNTDNNDGVNDAPGADDNGSATSAVIEAARALAPHRFHATIIFATFDGEEQGLLGSDHLAKMLRAQNVDVAGDLNNDIIGSSHGPDGSYDADHVRLFSEALPLGADRRTVNANGSENDSPSRELARFVMNTDALYVPQMHTEMIYRADRFHRGGDEESFTAAGFPATRFVEPQENYNHQHQNVRVENGVQYGDLLQYVDFNYLANVTKMNVAALAALALGPSAPSKAEILNPRPVYDSTLRWNRVPGAVSYEIVWRKTTAPDWENAKNVGDVTQATVPVNKDNFLLGVRAVDAQGHRSVVSFPTPVRS